MTLSHISIHLLRYNINNIDTSLILGVLPNKHKGYSMNKYLKSVKDSFKIYQATTLLF